MPEELAMQIPAIKDFLDDGYQTFEIEGYEGDDIIGTFAKKAKGKITMSSSKRR